MTDQQPQPEEPTVTPLSDLDADVFDALLAQRLAGSTTGPLPPDSAERAEQVRKLMGVLDALDADADSDTAPPADLTSRTMAYVAAAKQREQLAAQIDVFRAAGSGRGFSFDWRQVGAAAAMVLVSLTLLFPVLERNHSEAQRLACAANLAQAGMGFGSYALDHQGVLPRGATQAGAQWWHVGKTPDSAEALKHSNAAHLYLLVRSGYTSPESLACPSNPHQPTPGTMTAKQHDWRSPAAVSFSYQNQFTTHHPRLEDGRLGAILADKNPLFVVRVGKVQQARGVAMTASSRVHKGTGQNILRTDGSVLWTVKPTISSRYLRGQDNIWVADGIEKYRGTESPRGDGDSFLVP